MHLKSISRKPVKAEDVSIGSLLTVIGQIITVIATFLTAKEAGSVTTE